MKKIFLLIGLLSFSALTLAEEKELRSSLEEMFAVTHMERMLDGPYQQLDRVFFNVVKGMEVPKSSRPIVKDFYAKYNALIKEELSWDKVKEPIIDSYSEVFTQEEVDELVRFYKTPVGQKMRSNMPQLMQASQQSIQAAVQAMMPKLQGMIQEMEQEVKRR